MNFALLRQSIKSNFAVWGLTTLILNVLLGQMVAMTATRALLGPMFYGMLVPALSAIFIIIVGNKLLAGQVDRGSMAYLLTAPVRRLTVTLTQTLYFIGALVVTFGSMMVTSLLVNHYAEAGFAKKILVELNFGALAIAFAFAGIMFLASGVFNLSKLSLGTGGS
ncbi:hypothetical protein [Limosilactobacillus fermentum]|uniref:hypothetical protein n=2 Tax=Limosilactobacillus fermentum TaxID=1613 RepID=UPI001EDD4800|nr:hypothetical protein [Limosilactobacillus fermentum]